MQESDLPENHVVKARHQSDGKRFFRISFSKLTYALIIFITLKIIIITLWWMFYVKSNKPDSVPYTTKPVAIRTSGVKSTQTTITEKLVTKLVVSLPEVMKQNKTVQQFVEASRGTVISQKEKKLYLETLLRFDHIWHKTHNLTYFLYGGTLLGAVRNQGYIPWDDDMDLMTAEDDKVLLEGLFRNTELGMRKQGFAKRKIFFKTPKPGVRHTWVGWNWPFLDIFYYRLKNNASELWDLSSPFNTSVSLVFPLRYIAFEGHLFPAPRCPYKVLDRLYGSGFMQRCCSNVYNHRLEAAHRQMTCVTCTTAQALYRNTQWIPQDPDPKDC